MGPEPLSLSHTKGGEYICSLRGQRSFRRGATTQALIAGLTEAIIDANNRCRKVERTKEKMQLQSIPDQYVEIMKALRQQLKFPEGI
jgi:hypothetical protein